MQRIPVFVAVGVLLAGCTEPPTQPETFTVPVFNHNANAIGGNFGAPLNAAEEVMPSGVINDSRARGNATFQLSRDGQSMTFMLSVANIENVTMAHIHRGAFGVNGPPVVWLYPAVDTDEPLAGGGGRIQGVIARGTFTAAHLVGPLAGGSMADLVDMLRAGLGYVNVHTSDGVPPANTGPGDFAAGEIRGQIQHRGH